MGIEQRTVEDISLYQKPPEGVNPQSIRPLAFNYPVYRRRYIRTYTDIDHMDEPDVDWLWCIRMDPEHEGVVV